MLRLQPSFRESVEASHPQLSMINDSLYPSDWSEAMRVRYHHPGHHDLCNGLDRAEFWNGYWVGIGCIAAR
jgi:hypothetical protein